MNPHPATTPGTFAFTDGVFSAITDYARWDPVETSAVSDIDHTTGVLPRLADLDFWLDRRMISPESFFAVRDNGRISGAQFIDTNGLFDRHLAAKVLDSGASYVLLSLQNISRAIAAAAVSLGAITGVGIHVNGYVTPPAAQALKPHTDPFSVVVVQVAGAKLWTVEGYDQPVEMTPGAMMYLRRGIRHCAQTVDTAFSYHLTFGIRDDLDQSARPRRAPEPRVLSTLDAVERR